MRQDGMKHAIVVITMVALLTGGCAGRTEGSSGTSAAGTGAAGRSFPGGPVARDGHVMPWPAELDVAGLEHEGANVLAFRIPFLRDDTEVVLSADAESALTAIARSAGKILLEPDAGIECTRLWPARANALHAYLVRRGVRHERFEDLKDTASASDASTMSAEPKGGCAARVLVMHPAMPAELSRVLNGTGHVHTRGVTMGIITAGTSKALPNGARGWMA